MRFTSRCWAAMTAVLAVATIPTMAHASDDYTVYSSRSAFESALGTSYTTTPAASGVTFTTGGAATSPITYAAGATGNLFGSSAESIGYSNTALGMLPGTLNMTLPTGLTAFGFDYAFNPARSAEGAIFEGTFCTTVLVAICHDYETEVLSNGIGFIGIKANSGVEAAAVSGWARNVQVANLTFAGAAAPTVTPEPATVALMATGLVALAGMGFARRRRNEG